jgi:hypothetical protein
MPVTQATPFFCPTYGAKYKLVRVETKEAVPDQQITCRKCGDPLPGSERHLILKYFLVDRGRRRASGALPRLRDTLKRQSHGRAHLAATGSSNSKKKAPRERG